jgi:hypothetical protein
MFISMALWKDFKDGAARGRSWEYTWCGEGFTRGYVSQRHHGRILGMTLQERGDEDIGVA